MSVPGYGYNKKDSDSNIIYVPYLLYINCDDAVWKVKVFKKYEDGQFISTEESLITSSSFNRDYNRVKSIEFDAEKVKIKNILTLQDNISTKI